MKPFVTPQSIFIIYSNNLLHLTSRISYQVRSRRLRVQNISEDFVVHEFVHMMAKMIFKLRIKA